ncbi:MAG: Gfo/Idh/MocA family oxidoreductase [Gemmataceae bacterium]|nr:Gfo/Idh/MocA family oxidoreductase [Gemmataceae bacterium]MDW8267325.1 Gfo/Idh/MocA family oxidoreductase [Gemmataceae bacterium]
MPLLNRRQFMRHTLAAAGTVVISGTKSSGRVLGANDTIHVAVAGLNGRGGAHISAFSSLPNVRITYLIDPDARTFGPKVKAVEAKGGGTPKTVKDVRQALDDKALDVISIATPNHWHALMTIWACQAGKDVYVEKPCSHNVREGRIAVEAARKYHRIVQHGTQSRSDGGWARVAEVIKSGRYGKLLVARGLCYKLRRSIGTKEVTAPPAELDFNLWLGPAAERPFHGNLVHYNWHWFWDFGNGDIGNQGVHQMDIARWMIPGNATLPKSVLSLGGRFGYSDQGETPNTQMAVFDFGETQLIFEVRGLPTEKYLGQAIGNVFHLEAGTIAGHQFYPKGSTKPEPLPAVEGPRRPGGNHFANFLAAVRSRNPADLNADILEGHYSSALGHLANVSYRLGTLVPFNPRTKAFGDNQEAYETLARLEEHLAKGNGLKLEGLQYRLGRKLVIDAKTETILGDAEANRLLTRDYRAPFVVPERL